MENKFGSSFKNEGGEEGYVDFTLWQLILIGASLAVIIANSFISSGDVMIWVVNFLLQIAIFTVLASVLALIGKAIFKRGWGAFFSVILILGALFGLYDAIRGYNIRKDMEEAYQKQVEAAKQQAAQQQNSQQESGQAIPSQK